MVNGNSGVIGIASDLIGGLKDNLLGTEGVLTDVNMLGMQRPLASVNIAAQLKEQGGILPSLQTGVKKMTAARKGGRTGGRTGAPRYRPQAPARRPSTEVAFEGTPIPEEDEVVFI